MAAATQKKSTSTTKKSGSSAKGGSTRAKKPLEPQKRPVRREVWGVILLVLSLCVGVSYFNIPAIFIDWFALLLKGLFGYGYWLACPALLLAALILLFHHGRPVQLRVICTLLIPVLLFAPDLTAFFNSKAEVVSYGALLLRLLSPFYFFFCINQIYAGALRGAGNSQMPMWIMLGSFVVFRQIYLYIMSNYISNEIIPIALSYPAGWFVCSVATLLYYHHCKFDSHRLVGD